MLIACAALSATDVSGAQSGVWSLANSPYNLTADVVVPTGQSLTIEPGVVVNINALYQIKAQGYIIAQGTETDSIRFTSSARWKGFRLEDTANASIFRYCVIEKTQVGINPINAPFSVYYSRIHDASDHCISVYGINGPAQTTIKHTKISGAVKSGIYIAQNTNVLIDSCDVYNNGSGSQYYGAIQLSNQSPTGECNSVISNNHIHHNYKQGVTAWDVSASSRINPFVQHNLIENNLTGVYFRHASGLIESNVIQNNFIVGNANSGAGIMIAGASAQPKITTNVVTGNYCGFYIGENATPNLGDPEGTTPNPGMNNISNNIDASNTPHSIVIYSGTGNVMAKNNMWGTTDTALIDASITDQLDNSALGLVTYNPIYVANNVSGTITYEGSTPYSTLLLYFIDYITQDMSQVFTIDNSGSYSLNVNPGHYFVQAIGGNLENEEIIPVVFGVYGGIENPTPLVINENETYNNINISLFNYTENTTYKVLNTFTHDNKTIYPLACIAPIGLESTALLYKEGDYIYYCGEMAFNTESNQWAPEYLDQAYPILKNTNYHSGDFWDLDGERAVNFGFVNNVQTDAGTFLTWRIAYLDSEFNTISNKIYYADSIGFVMMRDFDNETGNLTLDQSLVSYDVSNGGEGLLPLASNNYWTMKINENPLDKPSYLSMTYDSTLVVFLTWDNAPGDNWTSNRIYKDNQLLATIPFTQSVYYFEHTDDLSHQWFVKAYDGTNESEPSNIYVQADNDNEVISVNKLSVKHYPNPISLNSKSLVNFNINMPEDGNAELNVFNIKGQKVMTVLNKDMAKGEHKIVWDGRNSNKRTLANGVYFYQLKTDKQVVTRKILILK